jgi:Uma2 family endonuclease
MAVQDRLYTAQDLEKMPDDGKIYELHNGVLVEVAGSRYKQTRLAMWIGHLLMVFDEEHNLGGVVTGPDGTFVLSTFNTRIPDVAYMTKESAQEQDDDSFMRGAPDLAVEVVSPSNTPTEMQQRAGEYLTAGSRLVWIVDLNKRTVDVYKPDGSRTVVSGEGVLDAGDVLPGLSLPLTTLFRPLAK